MVTIFDKYIQSFHVLKAPVVFVPRMNQKES